MFLRCPYPHRVASLFVNSFYPLVKTPAGRIAAKRHGLPPFIDGSIRREPDLEHPMPVITCLCRTDKFAPRLRPGDRVAYWTSPPRERRLVAILAVERVFKAHNDAAMWFKERSLPLPSNLVVDGNAAKPLDLSSRDNENKNLPEDQWHREWENQYIDRARRFPIVVGCIPLFVDVQWSAPRLSDDDLKAVFGGRPGTQNPPQLDATLLPRLLQQIGLDVRLPL